MEIALWNQGAIIIIRFAIPIGVTYTQICLARNPHNLLNTGESEQGMGWGGWAGVSSVFKVKGCVLKASS